MAHSSILFLTIPLALSAFTHLWNPIGFPSIYIDENIYIQRALVASQGNGPIDKSSVYPPYDHPFFGQVFLASIFRVIGYPHPFSQPIAKGDVHSIEMLYFVPRVLMGILAVIDTFLVYKIAECRYNNRNIAFIASVLFAVMPMTWLLKMIMLESIQLPFILLAVLFAIYIKDSKNANKHKKIMMPLLSGIFVGLAILTKMPAIAIIPLGAFLAYTGSKQLKILGLWFIPVILIPLIWPAYAFFVGDLKHWLDGVYLQTHRGDVAYKPVSISTSVRYLFEIDPVLMILGSSAVVFAAIKRDFFLLLWAVPLMIFFYFVHSQFFLLTPILAAFCIATAKMINDLSNLIMSKNIRSMVSLSTISLIGIFGLVSTGHLITINLNSTYFEAAAFVAKFLSQNSNNSSTNDGKNKIAVVSQDRYYWIPQKVLQEDQYYKVWDGIHFSKYEQAGNVLLIIDDPAKYLLNSHSQNTSNESIQKLRALYDSTFPVAAFEKNRYFSTVGDWNHIDGQYTSKVEIRTNRTNDMLLNSSAFIVDVQNGTIIKDGSKLKIIIPVTENDIPSYWNDSLKNCDNVFKCTANVTTGWKDSNSNNKTSFQVSTNTTSKNTWSSIYGNEIGVKPGEQYQFITHMKLNDFATQSHVSIEAYNQTSNKWTQIAQCPIGTNGPLEWHEYSCEITIPANIMKIRPVLNAGWSSQLGKQAVTLFDAIYLGRPPAAESTDTNVITSDSNLLSNPGFIDFIKGSIASLCQLSGDFDIQVSYKVLDKPHSANLIRLNLIAQNDSITYNNSVNAMQHESSYTANETSQTLGMLRMIRSGSSIEEYYYSSGKWIPISFGHVNPIDVNIIVQMETHGIFIHQPVEMAFDDHVINKGHIVNCDIN